MSLEDVTKDEVYSQRPNKEIQEQSFKAEGQITVRIDSIEELAKLQDILESQVGVSYVTCAIDFETEIDVLHHDMAHDLGLNELDARTKQVKNIMKEQNVDGDVVRRDDAYWIDIEQ